MALEHSYYWQFPLNSDQFNKVIEGLVSPGVYDGFIVTAASMTLAINVGAGQVSGTSGRCLLPNGTTVWNTQALVNAAACGVNTSASPRIDAVVMEYIHGSDPNVNKPRVKILDGTPALNPVIPTLDPDSQLLLATIRLPGGATSINDSMITNVERVVQVTGAAARFPHPSGTVDTLSYDKTTKPADPGLVASIDLRTNTYIPASMMMTAAKMAMEGIYAGAFSITHTFNTYNKPSASVVSLVDAGVTVNVTYGYNDNQTLASRVMTIPSRYTLTETYEYTNQYSMLPNVIQTIEVL